MQRATCNHRKMKNERSYDEEKLTGSLRTYELFVPYVLKSVNQLKNKEVVSVNVSLPGFSSVKTTTKSNEQEDEQEVGP